MEEDAGDTKEGIICPPIKDYKIKLEKDIITIKVEDEPEEQELKPVLNIFLPGLPMESDVEIFEIEVANEAEPKENDLFGSYPIKQEIKEELDIDNAIAAQVANVSIKAEPTSEPDEIHASFEENFKIEEMTKNEFEETWHNPEELESCNIEEVQNQETIEMTEDIGETQNEDLNASEPPAARLLCPLCPAQLKHPGMFLKHFLKRHKQSLYCLKCTNVYKKCDAAKLDKHSVECSELQNTMFSDEENFDSCDENFQISKTHHCQLCGNTFSDSKTIAEHFISRHPRFVYCPKCKIILTVQDREKLLYHSKTCYKIPLQKITQLVCDICFCGQSFDTVEALNMHKICMHDFDPKELTKGFSQKSTDTHCKNRESKGTCTSTDNNPFLLLREVSQITKELKSNVISMISKWVNIWNEKLPSSVKDFKFIISCPVCEIDFPYASYITTHLENFPKVHCKCPFCGKKAINRSEEVGNFLLHVASHFENEIKVVKCRDKNCKYLFFNIFNSLVHAKNRHKNESARNALIRLIKKNELDEKRNLLKRKMANSPVKTDQVKKQSLVLNNTTEQVKSSAPESDKQIVTNKSGNLSIGNKPQQNQAPISSTVNQACTSKFAAIKNLISCLKAYYSSQPPNKQYEIVIYCPVCMQDIVAEVYFNSHYEKCIKNNKFKCPFCKDILLVKTQSVEMHIGTHFPQTINAILCSPCKFLFLDSYNYTVHTSIQHASFITVPTDAEKNPPKQEAINVTNLLKFKTVKDGRDIIYGFFKDLRNHLSTVQRIIVHCASCSTDMLCNTYFDTKHFDMCRNAEKKFVCSFCTDLKHQRSQGLLTRLHNIADHLSNYKLKIICTHCNFVLLSKHNLNLHMANKHKKDAGSNPADVVGVSQSKKSSILNAKQTQNNSSTLVNNVVSERLENHNPSSSNSKNSVVKKLRFDNEDLIINEIINHIYDELRKYKSYSAKHTHVIYCLKCTSCVLVDNFFKSHIKECMAYSFHCPFCKIVSQTESIENTMQHLKKHVFETRILHLSCSCNHVFINSCNRMTHMTVKKHVLPRMPPS